MAIFQSTGHVCPGGCDPDNRPKTIKSVSTLRINVVSSLPTGLTCFLRTSTRYDAEISGRLLIETLYICPISYNSMHASYGELSQVCNCVKVAIWLKEPAQRL